FVKFGGSTIYNYDGRKYGETTITTVLEKSINTGAVFVEELLPHDIFLEYIEAFGFFEKTGIDIPEIYSENKELKKGYEINFATCSFGQGIEMTPIQLIRAFSVIANGGNLVTPYIIKKEGNDVKKPEVLRRVISSNTASQLSAMLVSVVENGYAKSAQVPGYYVAGKTGTAQVPERGTYSTEKTIQTFLGYSPAFDPKFLVLIKLDNPTTKTAEYSAVPMFHDIAKYIIDYWQIPPDYSN
ncbi:penicillin-binding transpeptidase domain-containing protein, partial [Patescibacteria group bacterium]